MIFSWFLPSSSFFSSSLSLFLSLLFLFFIFLHKTKVGKMEVQACTL